MHPTSSLSKEDSEGKVDQKLYRAHTIEHEEFLEVIKLDGVAHSPEDTMMARELLLLQLCSGMDENAIGTCAELIFAPIDASFADDAPLLPSGFRIIPLESGKEASSPNRTLDLASALDVGGPTGNRASSDNAGNSGCVRSVMTIAFEFAFESHMQENVACMACQYVRSIISSVQRVALALSPSHMSSHAGLRSPLGTPEAQTLAHWICNSYSAEVRQLVGQCVLLLDFFFFEKKFNFCPPDDAWARKNFERRGAAIMKNNLSKVRLTRRRPSWISQKLWNTLDKHWKISKYKKKRMQAKTNRASDRDSFGKPLHTCGSITTSQHRANLTETNGTPPDPVDLFVYTYQHRKNNLAWVDRKSEHVYGKYKHRLEE
ncbi:hypothetical protein P8452_17480 [Trifolium repens]|nr:hypothetical protein P8452_17480 [Trifolium repens]